MRFNRLERMVYRIRKNQSYSRGFSLKHILVLSCKSWQFTELILFRKLVLLKLEKGYEYGDAILGGTIPHFPNYQKELRVSLVDEMKAKGKKSLKIVCQEGSVAEQYACTPGYTVEEDLVRVPGDFKAAVERGCQVWIQLPLCEKYSVSYHILITY